jgi:hypothetical protein
VLCGGNSGASDLKDQLENSQLDVAISPLDVHLLPIRVLFVIVV